MYTFVDQIAHPEVAKTHQIRGTKRDIFKVEIRNEMPFNFRDKKIVEQSTALRILGNYQVPSKSVVRKIKAEDERALDRDTDNFYDLAKMYDDPKWKNFIQFHGRPQEIYLFSKEQLAILQANRKHILK